MLRVSDIDSKRMLIRVEQGKGKQGPACDALAAAARAAARWWLQCRSQGWLFPGRDPLLPITARQLNRVCHMAAEAAGLGTWVSPHTLRHSFRHASAGEQHRRARDPGAARARQVGDDGALHARRHQRAARGHQPARSAGAAAAKDGRSRRPSQPARRGSASSGGRGHLPRPRCRLA